MNESIVSISGSEIQNFLSQNWLTALNIILLLLTAYLSYTSYKFQTRAAIRESIEQLDDVELGRREKLRPLLHSFDFRLIRDSETVVALRHYYLPNDAYTASRADLQFLHNMMHKSTTGNKLTRSQIEKALIEMVEKIEGVGRTWIDNKRLYFTINSRNAVEVRMKTESVLDLIADNYSESEGAAINNLDMEVDE